jgi:hypothetical protein
MQDRLTEASEQSRVEHLRGASSRTTCSRWPGGELLPACHTSSQACRVVPTIDLSVNVRNIPVSSWLKCDFRTRSSTRPAGETVSLDEAASSSDITPNRQFRKWHNPSAAEHGDGRLSRDLPTSSTVSGIAQHRISIGIQRE